METVLQNALRVFEEIKKDYEYIFKLIEEEEENSSFEERDSFTYSITTYITGEIRNKNLDMGLCIKIDYMSNTTYKGEILHILNVYKDTDRYWYPTYNDTIVITDIVKAVEKCLTPRYKDVCNIIEKIKEGEYDYI